MRRAAASVFVILLISTVTFFIMYVVPTDPASAIAGPRATTRDIVAIREQIGRAHV